MRGGRLDRRLKIERPRPLTPGGDGHPDPTKWDEVATVWAAKEDLSDAERVRAGEVGGTATTRFLIRWSSEVADVGPECRGWCDGRLHEFVGVKEAREGRRAGIEITAVARTERPS